MGTGTLGGTRSAKVASALLALSILILASVVVPAHKGGMGDGDVDAGGCICHTGTTDTTLSVKASLGDADTRWVPTDGTIDIHVNIALGGTVGDILGIGLFVPDGEDQVPISGDGWSVVRDPRGGTDGYVEMPVQKGADHLPLGWTLSAPPTIGHYTLIAGAFHGGGTPVKAFSSILSVDTIDGGTLQVLDVAFEPEALPGVPIPVGITMFGPSDVASLKLSYKPTDADTGPHSVNAERDASFPGEGGLSRFTAMLPAQTGEGNLTFHIQAMAGGSSASWPAKGDATVFITFAIHPTVKHDRPAPGLTFGKKAALDFVVEAEMDPSQFEFRSIGAILSYRWEGLRDPIQSVSVNRFTSGGPRGHFTFETPPVMKAGRFEYSLLVNLTYSKPGFDFIYVQSYRFDYITEVLPDIEIRSMAVFGDPKEDGEVEVEVTIIDHSNVPIFDMTLILTDYPVDDKDTSRPNTFQRSNVSLLPDKENKVRIWWRPRDEGERRLLVVTSLPPGRVDPDTSNDRISTTVDVGPRDTDLSEFPLRDLLELAALAAICVVAFSISQMTRARKKEGGGGRG